MLYKDNEYTEQLAYLISNTAKTADKRNKTGFLVNGSVIYGTVLPIDDERLDIHSYENDKIKISSVVFTPAAAIVSERDKKLSSSSYEELESVYIYLEDVTIFSGNGRHNIPDMALRISSIDAIFAGSAPELQ